MKHFHEQRERYTFTKRVASRFIQNLPKLSIGFTRAILGTFLFAANPLAAQVGDVTWAAHNQTMSVNLGVVQHDYSENDPYGLTTDGVMDTEHGTLSSPELGARWQAETIPLFTQATIRRSNGRTHYQGYLQSGGALTPYSATTGNIMLDFAVRAGMPVAQGSSWQWVPFIEYQQHSWQRELVQYTENFNHTAGLIGLQVQWRQHADSAAANSPWSFEMEGATGKMLSANMNASSLGFNQPLGKRDLWQLGIKVSYDLTPRWVLNSSAATRHFSYGQSAAQGGLIEPASQTTQTTFGIGLGWRY